MHVRSRCDVHTLCEGIRKYWMPRYPAIHKRAFYMDGRFPNLYTSNTSWKDCNTRSLASWHRQGARSSAEYSKRKNCKRGHGHATPSIDRYLRILTYAVQLPNGLARSVAPHLNLRRGTFVLETTVGMRGAHASRLCILNLACCPRAGRSLPYGIWDLALHPASLPIIRPCGGKINR